MTPDDGVRDRSDDPATLARLLRLALLRVARETTSPDPLDPLVLGDPADPTVVEARWTAADLLRAGWDHDLRVTVTLGFGGPATEPVVVRLDRCPPTAADPSHVPTTSSPTTSTPTPTEPTTDTREHDQ